MTAFPGYIAWKSFLPGPESKGYSYITNDADLIVAEANAQPGEWKWFPVSGTNQVTEAKAAAAWAGVPYKGTAGGSPSADIPDPSSVVSGAGSVASFLAKLGTRQLWVRIAKVVAGLALVIIGAIQLTNISKTVLPAAAKAAMLA